MRILYSPTKHMNIIIGHSDEGNCSHFCKKVIYILLQVRGAGTKILVLEVYQEVLRGSPPGGRRESRTEEGDSGLISVIASSLDKARWLGLCHLWQPVMDTEHTEKGVPLQQSSLCSAMSHDQKRGHRGSTAQSPSIWRCVALIWKGGRVRVIASLCIVIEQYSSPWVFGIKNLGRACSLDTQKLPPWPHRTAGALMALRHPLYLTSTFSFFPRTPLPSVFVINRICAFCFKQSEWLLNKYCYLLISGKDRFIKAIVDTSVIIHYEIHSQNKTK